MNMMNTKAILMTTINEIFKKHRRYLFESFNLNEVKLTKDASIGIFSKYGVPNADSLSNLDLKKAYRNLVYKHHPDRGGDTKIMQDINAAYEILKQFSSSYVHPPANENEIIYNVRKKFYFYEMYELTEQEQKYAKILLEKILQFNKSFPNNLDKEDIKKANILIKKLLGYSLHGSMDDFAHDIEQEINFQVMYCHAWVFILRQIDHHNGLETFLNK